MLSIAYDGRGGIDPEQRYQAYLAQLRQEFPRLRLIRKDRSRFSRAIHYALVVVTFGGMREFLDGYQTTIRRTIYVTSDWDNLDPDERYVTMRHEAVHLRQFRRYTLPGLAVLYILLPLPLGLSYFRAHFEKQGYEETIRASAEVYGREHVTEGWFRDHIIEQFMGPSYGWMWPFRRQLQSWYDGILQTIAV